MSAHKEMTETKEILIKMGHIVDMPPLDNIENELDNDGNAVETAHIKIKEDLIRGYFNKIKENDAVLAINVDKKGIPGYIGPNTFLEIGFGYVLNKRVYILNSFSEELSYVDEINAMQPIILDGSLEKIN